MALFSLDDWMDEPAIRTHHRRTAAVPQDELWRAALEVRLDDTRALGRLVRWRIPDTPGDQSFARLFRSYPFTVLEEDEHLLVSGLCGRIWTLTRDYPALAGADAFRDWDENGTVRVIFAHWAAPQADGSGRAGLRGARATRRSHRGAAPEGAVGGGGALRAPGGGGGAHGCGPAGGESSPSSKPASGETASMTVRRPRRTRSRRRPASS